MKQLSQIYPVLLLITCLSGCSSISYYTQAISGHLALTTAGEPLDSYIVNPDTPDGLRDKLTLSRQALRFAAERLGLPADGAFKDYVVLDRPWVVVNLVAVPEFSLQAHRWCYPVLGCQAYRGYFQLEDAQWEAQRFQAEGYDTFIGGVTAYSTLGWFDDPLHSGFTNLPDDRMVALMFHELAHRVVYIKKDTAFNESFATAVELEGLKLWLTHQGEPSVFEQALVRFELRNKTYALIESASADLERLYQQQDVLSESSLRERKRLVFENLDAAYEALLADDSQRTASRGNRYEIKVASGAPPVAFNNARIALFTQYNQHVPAFRELLKQSDYNFPAFYRAVELLSRQPGSQRQQRLHDLSERFEEHF